MKTQIATDNRGYEFDENTVKRLFELGFKYGCNKTQLVDKNREVWIYPKERNNYSITVVLYRCPEDKKTWTKLWDSKLDRIRELIRKVEEILKEKS